MFKEFLKIFFDEKQNGEIIRLYWNWDDIHTLWMHERSVILQLLHYPIWEQLKTWTEYFCYFKTLPMFSDNCRPMISPDRSRVLSHKHELCFTRNNYVLMKLIIVSSVDQFNCNKRKRRTLFKRYCDLFCCNYFSINNCDIRDKYVARHGYVAT